MSKGHTQRPTDKANFDKGFDRIFNKPVKQPSSKPKDYSEALDSVKAVK